MTIESLIEVYRANEFYIPESDRLPAHKEWISVLKYQGKSDRYLILHDLDLPADDALDTSLTARMLYTDDPQEARKIAKEMFSEFEKRIREAAKTN